MTHLITIELPLNHSMYDAEYGRLDFAPRFIGRGKLEGEVGWIVSYKPASRLYLGICERSYSEEFESLPNEYQTFIEMKSFVDFEIIGGGGIPR